MKKLANGIYRLTLGTPEAITPIRVLKPASRWDTLNRLPDYDLPFQDADVSFRKTRRGFLIEIPLAQGEDVYGLGLQLKSFRQTAHKKMLRVNSDPAADTGDSHAPVPFYVTGKGYGVLVDTARYATFYAGNVKKVNGDRDKAGIRSADNPGMWWQIRDGSGNMVIDIPAAAGVDLYFFAGDSMKDAVSRYNLFSGGGPKIPIWGLGILYRGYMHADSGHIRRLAKSLRDDRLPCDIFGLEPGWQTHSYSCTYCWDSERFPDHREMSAWLSENGFKLNLWEHAYVHPSSSAFEKLAPYSGDNFVWDGRVPDFLTEEGTALFLETQEPLIEEGITGFKLDECDNSDFLSNWGFPDYTQFPSGADGEQMHSLFGLLYQRTLLNAYQKRGRRTMGQARSSGACAAPYPFVLYSDLYNHDDFVRGMGSAAFSGLLWSPEVRQAGSEEELLRRIAAVIASPQALLNCFMIPSPPWKQYDLEKNLAGELLDDSVALTDKVRGLFELRMQLVPHLYTAFCEYEQNGTPPIRPLVMDYPDDKNVLDLWDEYLLGEGLLAAPVIFGSADRNAREIYLPAGTWYDFYTNERLEGGKAYYREIPAECLPLFVREGTLLAIADPLPYIAENQVFDISLRLYGENATCKLYLDDSFCASAVRFVTADKNGIPDNPQYHCIAIEKRA
jgi:alpha-D-xyloside xylohydrolase